MTSPLRVLVVEDDVAMLGYLLTVLGGWGYIAEGACSAREALEIVRDRCPDVMLSDLVMPGMDGMQLLRALRSVPDCSIFFVLITGYPTVPSLVDAITKGADDCLLKPIDVQKLHTILETFERRRVAT